MRVDIYVYSTTSNGALAKSFFTKSFQWQSAPPAIGTIIPLQSNHGKGRLHPGVVTDVKITDNTATVKVGTETSKEDLRDSFIPDNWKEISILPE
ncbi:MAG: hypothetical protein A3A98_02990 [Candidatus Staskawiczbacteria bacterium RIFCSPLOWO2_01_FULL_40_39]|uniref:Uncharacterized protein n=1 Tax=Candidatus Staskawiczbacteria bacterium RIFCSPHIGHO2_01_FULL_39_25 TaxID=1802202 RepID=A0A1G2HQC5_9BACT|nr:MAG: hypothetical protein A2730_01455 [Candidatus Staskawiczbacteria bacterium RIFCSPHIGHO2_01_FULL_39_25]OGZ73853.1 MAG: hypothetical protein A3A98_02990 [Candidatus Staskawiczbacteria bacterium RIFCSPLOWO2_01_FULL_40_39]OGZ75891.1 MAG: hypothetical protein A3I87_00020 [Candidatus Staskawiczbacteria bacterium RIFCSPLOWO2_02_FULL_39_8]